ncbi:MAG: nuclear transport factor 2 family protein [Pseudomonadota bacterium]|nr:nuclear transport factor 2 family protein [Pseudomonadota bacterium]
MTNSSAVAISNLLYLYAELIDSDELELAADLFRHARIKVRHTSESISADELLGIWRRLVRIYSCGTPRTRHLVSNIILDMDEKAGRAKTRSCYTVYQATEDLPIQLIAAGRYHDEFQRPDGVWRFSYRDYSLLDMVGDTSEHLTQSVGGSG